MIVGLAALIALAFAAGYLARDLKRSPNLFAQAVAVFDRMEADAKARGCTQDINRYRRARKAFAEAVLRGGR